MGPWLFCADAFRTVTGSSGGAICSEAVQFVQRLIAMPIHCVWLLLCVSHVEICSTIVAVWASCYVKQAGHTWQFWNYARNTFAPLLLVAFASALLAHLLGVGGYSKFQIQVEYYTWTIPIQKWASIRYFRILKFSPTFCNSRQLKFCYCSPSAKQNNRKLSVVKQWKKVLKQCTKKVIMQALFSVLQQKPTWQPVIFACGLSFIVYGNLVVWQFYNQCVLSGNSPFLRHTNPSAAFFSFHNFSHFWKATHTAPIHSWKACLQRCSKDVDSLLVQFFKWQLVILCLKLILIVPYKKPVHLLHKRWNFIILKFNFYCNMSKYSRRWIFLHKEPHNFLSYREIGKSLPPFHSVKNNQRSCIGMTIVITILICIVIAILIE